MARQSKRMGRSLTYVLDNASTEHLTLYLQQPDENFAVVSASLSSIEDHDEESLRRVFLPADLSKLSLEDLQPIETESQRIYLLAEGKAQTASTGPETPFIQRGI